jgi:hypothetical protein
MSSLRLLVSTLSALLLLLAVFSSPISASPAPEAAPAPVPAPVPAPAGETVKPAIYTGSDKYIYQGCYNETVDIPNTAKDRALPGGMNTVMAGNMTVPLCLAFCNQNGFRYAGVEYSRECWCAVHLSSLSVKLPDSECNLACDGQPAMICGGPWKLSVYKADNVGTNGAAGLASGSVFGLVSIAALTYLFL